MQNTYVYILLNPLKKGIFKYKDLTLFEEPFYVGIGRHRRVFAHFSEKEWAREKSHKNNVIKGIFKKNKKPSILYFVKNIERKKASDLEVALISQIGRRDLKKGPLCNKTDGGDADTSMYRKYPKGKDVLPHIYYMLSKKKNFNHSNETKNKMSLASKGVKKTEEHKKALRKAWKKRKIEGKYLKKHSEETKLKISKKNKGKIDPPEVKAKMSLAKLGTKRPKSVKLKISNTLKRLYKEGKR